MPQNDPDGDQVALENHKWMTLGKRSSSKEDRKSKLTIRER